LRINPPLCRLTLTTPKGLKFARVFATKCPRSFNYCATDCVSLGAEISGGGFGRRNGKRAAASPDGRAWPITQFVNRDAASVISAPADSGGGLTPVSVYFSRF